MANSLWFHEPKIRTLTRPGAAAHTYPAALKVTETKNGQEFYQKKVDRKCRDQMLGRNKQHLPVKGTHN